MRAALALLAIGTVPVTACSPSDNDPGPGGVTVGEARALDEAAEMIEQRRIPADVLAEKELASESAASEATAGENAAGATAGNEPNTGQNTGE
ncbi:hypothetical protein [Erythrobacter sp. A6_0]|uniref:hypothetical protein n=1 Tax=Erythrobacter sp. A6_0 TaxID=2821089 RepID=UPI001ADA95DC|nr:hypothetical protein [Erythrobacter sp. A6_0]MBO9511759.1 hypothetical protein [Erythrobacter sp. A6_0]